ncbi:GAF domain-containing sensor histidine kinase [Limimaricola pyoseonensis]|uniref:histidine kinase n=1 Tax=Limimaricola pyoseonensis TaxID=521013 RepID=A0A1G7JJ61_9RHOB|nr:ATP-binding protein [Limimaricola pyoseonensis]SDF24905.1 PAS domain S-box-containing protein [Limimaricola pyoseonensis]
MLETSPISEADPGTAPVPESYLGRLYYIAADPDKTFETKANELLEIGCAALGLSLGIISRVEGRRYEVLHSHSRGDAPPEPGTAFNLSDTYCCHTLVAEDVTGFHHVGQSQIASHPCYANFGLESYIGTPLVVNGEVFGTLNFSAAEPRHVAFGAEECELVRFFGRWFSKEWERAIESAELERKTTLLEAIFEAMPGSVIVADLERRITMTNRTVREMFGFAPEHLEGRQTSILYSDFEQYNQTGAQRFNAAATGALAPYEMSYRRQDGQDFIGETHATRITTRDGKRLGYLAVIRDITERKRVERQRDHAISVISHEIKTPVSTVAGALQLLGRVSEHLPERGRQLLDISTRNTERLNLLIDDILESGRLRSGQFSMSTQDTDLGELLHGCVQDHAVIASENGVKLRIVGDLEPVTVTANPLRLTQVINNLLTNAMKASPPSGTVELGLLRDPAGFWISDSGVGIPEKLRPVLFDRFTRSETETFRFGGGSGLGLSIVKAIVDQHRAEITFDTVEGEGTTFRVVFPDDAA